MNPNIVIFGAGAVGAYLAASLARAGREVTVVDPWFQNVEAINSNGINVQTPEEEFVVPVKALHLDELGRLNNAIDIFVLAVKSYDTEWVTRLMREYLNPMTMVLSAQNGMNEERIVQLIRPEQVVGCVITMAAESFEPATTRKMTSRDSLTCMFGEMDGSSTARVQHLAEVFEPVGKVRLTTNMWGELWAKLALNAMSNSAAALTGETPRSLWTNPIAVELEIHLAGEAVVVSEALGFHMESVLLRLSPEILLKAHLGDPDARREVSVAMEAAASKRVGKFENKSSMLVDILRDRRTEIDYLNGYIVRRGSELNLSTPVNEAMVSLVHDVEHRRLKADPSNLDLVVNLVSSYL